MSATNLETEIDTDFYQAASLQHPLLTAAQEHTYDCRKWAAARRTLRLVMHHEGGRQVLRHFIDACRTNPPVVENFEPRSLYFNLRKDIDQLLTGSEHQHRMARFSKQLETASAAELLTATAKMEWPATLQVALGIALYRASGRPMPDAVTDAVQIWIPELAQLRVDLEPRQRRQLWKAIRLYMRERDKLVMHNLRLAHKLARDYQGRGIPLSDLVQDGVIGLVRAAEKYDYRRGFRFTTYAFNWINQHLKRSSEGRGSLITYPSHVTQEINQLHRIRSQHQEKTGKDASTDELVQQSGFDLGKVRRLRSLTNITVSLDQPAAGQDDNDWKLGDSLEDPNSTRAVQRAEQGSLKGLLMKKIGKLEAREQAVIFGRWGLDGQRQRTFSQLAEELHVSREWVRQLEKSALKKLGEEAALGDALHDYSHA